MKSRWFVWLLAVLGIIGATLFIVSLIQTSENNFLCSITRTMQQQQQQFTDGPTSMQLKAILHYATSQVSTNVNDFFLLFSYFLIIHPTKLISLLFCRLSLNNLFPRLQ